MRSYCPAPWTSRSLYSSACWRQRSEPSPFVSSGTILSCEPALTPGCESKAQAPGTSSLTLVSLTPPCSRRVSGTGGWSARGCEVVFRNESHVSCQCNHMTSFAVLMDVSRREVGQPPNTPPLGNEGDSTGAAFLIRPASCSNPDTDPAEWRDPAAEDTDLCGSGHHTGYPSAHLPLPHRPASPALQPAWDSTESDSCSRPGPARFPPGSQPG